ncbi:MAG: EamA family transporter [Ekhidna sp.]|nr:EamA family transporter [Ekhidna sp.]
MKLNVLGLFAVPVLIWGSTFYVIKFQLGVVDPTWSVSYRFILSGVILLGVAKLKKLNLLFTPPQHRFIFQQGILLFGLNYLLIYVAEEQLTSALVAVAFSTIVFLNILFGAIFLKRKSEKKVSVGALLGVAGTFLLFRNDLLDIRFDELPLFHLSICLLAVVIASLGNITSAYNQANSLPVLQTNAFGMLYGGIFIGIIALVSGRSIAFDFRIEYSFSLLYLSIFGSILAFGAYLTLVGKIGADKAAYVLIIIPVIAVFLSIIFEGYEFNIQVILGMFLILGGNLIVVQKKS